MRTELIIAKKDYFKATETVTIALWQKERFKKLGYRFPLEFENKKQEEKAWMERFGD